MIGSVPAFIITEEPVPYVALTIPFSMQPCPNSAPWESPITPQIGIGVWKYPSKSVTPYSLLESHTSGSISALMPNQVQISLSHFRLWILKSWVLDALE